MGNLSKPVCKRGRLQRACLKLLRQHEADGALPTIGRFIFYELVQAGDIPKSYKDQKKQPAAEVSEALLYLREHDIIPWEWIVDETRTMHQWEFAPSVSEYLRSQLDIASIDAWGGEEAPLIICESSAAAGVLRSIAAEYLVPITAVRGQCAGFIVTEIVPLMRNGRRVLYIGDWEERGPGEQIEANTKKYIEEHAKRTFHDSDWERLALTTEQVEANPRLKELKITKYDQRNATRTNPVKRPAKRYVAVECEAIGQVILQDILRDRLDELLPEPLETVRVREREQRERMARILDEIEEES